MNARQEQDDLAASFERLPRLLADNADLIRRGVFFDARFLVQIGDVPFDMTIAAGQIVSFQRGPFVMPTWRFAVRGTVEAWREFWRPIPNPGWHDLFALNKRGVLTLEGDLHPLMSNLQYIKDLLALPRKLASES